jgi:hypothetical protein
MLKFTDDVNLGYGRFGRRSESMFALAVPYMICSSPTVGLIYPDCIPPARRW